jgi:hypothetical protein
MEYHRSRSRVLEGLGNAGRPIVEEIDLDYQRSQQRLIFNLML